MARRAGRTHAGQVSLHFGADEDERGLPFDEPGPEPPEAVDDPFREPEPDGQPWEAAPPTTPAASDAGSNGAPKNDYCPLAEPRISMDAAADGCSGTGAAPVNEGPVDDEAVGRMFGRSVDDIIDLDRWQHNPDPSELIRSVNRQVRRVVEREKERRAPLRRMVEEEILSAPDRPPNAGFQRVSEAELLRVARTVLYNGKTEAACGEYVSHDTVPLAIGQAGVSVVGYSGNQQQWYQRFIRRDFEIELEDPLEEVAAVLQARDRIGQPGVPNRLEQSSELARRGVVSFMERLVLLRQCPGKWRMGDGVPIPLDLLTTRSGSARLAERSLEMLRELLLGDARWVFVANPGMEPGLQMIADALEPLEMVILMRQHHRLRERVLHTDYPSGLERRALDFAEEVGPQVVLGAFRAGPFSPAWFFFAHEDRAEEAGLIAMADALALQPDGFPPLLRLAKANVHAALGGPAFRQLVEQAYREAGAEEWFFRSQIR